MSRIKVTISITVKADRDDEEGLKDAVTDKLLEMIEAEELEFEVDDDGDDD